MIKIERLKMLRMDDFFVLAKYIVLMTTTMMIWYCDIRGLFKGVFEDDDTSITTRACLSSSSSLGQAAGRPYFRIWALVQEHNKIWQKFLEWTVGHFQNQISDCYSKRDGRWGKSLKNETWPSGFAAAITVLSISKCIIISSWYFRCFTHNYS